MRRRLVLLRKNKIALFVVLLVVMVCGRGFSFLSSEGVVKLGNKVLFRFYDSGGRERAERVQRKIESLILQNLSPEELWIDEEGDSAYIYWGTEVITGVNLSYARRNDSTPKALCRVWLKNLKTALTGKNFFLVPSKVRVPLRGKTIVKVFGRAKGEIYTEGGNKVEVSVCEGGNAILIKGVEGGEERIFFKRGNLKASLDVVVLEPPASFPKQLETMVAGRRVPPYMVRYACKRAVLSKVKLKSGARVDVEKIEDAKEVEAGKDLLAYALVKACGENYVPVRKKIPVLVKNVGDVFSCVDQLMVSDRPEAFDKDGVLFKGTLLKGKTVRLLFYHKNASEVDRHFWIEIKNSSSKKALVILNGSIAGPSRWGVTVGHQAAIGLLKVYSSGAAVGVEVPAKGSLYLLNVNLPSDKVIAGYIHIGVLQGDHLEVLVKNSAKGIEENLPHLYQPFDPFKIHPKGVFSPANLSWHLTYVAGEDDGVECVVGMAPWLIDATTGEPNNGNYGVIYEFHITLKNPTSSKQRLGFFFIPENVLARGTFILDGNLVETGVVRKPAQRLFAVIDLMPSEERKITLVTTPEGGSYYPVKIQVKPVSEDVKVDLNITTKDEDVEE